FGCDIRKNFAIAFKTWRQRNSLLLKQIAADLGVSANTVNLWEMGRRFPTGKNGSILKFVFGSGYWFLSFCTGASPGAKNRSPNTMANWFIAACQCCAGTFHPRTMLRKAK